MQRLFATYALKWKDYLLTLTLMRHLGCFVPIHCHFAVCQNVSRFPTNKNPASRNIRTGKANQKTFLVAKRSPTSRAQASRVEQQLLNVCLTECKNRANHVPTNGGTCGRAFCITPNWAQRAKYKRSHPSSNWPSWRAQSERGGGKKYRRSPPRGQGPWLNAGEPQTP